MVDIIYEVEEECNDKFEFFVSFNLGSGNGISVVGMLGFIFNNFFVCELFWGNFVGVYGDG